MADTDVLGIVSLLLAAGGAAYLFRSRLIAQRAQVQAEEAAASSVRDAESQRRADTVPPKLRPADPPEVRIPKSSKPPDIKEKAPIDPSSPLGPPAVGEKKSDFWNEPKPPPSSSRRSTKGATVVMPNAPAASAKPPPPASSSSPLAGEAKQASSPSSAKSPKPPSAPTPPAPPSSAKVMKPQAGAATPAKPAAKTAKAASPPSPAAPPSSISPTKLGAKAKDEEEKAKKKADALKKQAAIQAEVPKLEVEEDEDVEPTKVGRVAASRREIQPPVDKIIVDAGAETMPVAAAPAKERVAIYSLAQTDPGKRRKQNEDSYLVIDKEQLFIVADGMGGHKGGQIASKLAVDTIKKAYDEKRFEAAAHKDLPVDASNLARALQMANAAILEEAGRRPELKGMGTTICGMRFSNNCQRLYIAHVGDSRCYRVRDGVMKQLTSDHTMADYGVAGPEGAHLSRALGVWPTVPIDVLLVEPKLGDLYLLCSDGLTKMLPDGTIATQLLHEDDPKAAVSRLVFFANAHGGKDNITVILLRIVEPGWKPPSVSSRGSKPEIA